jgi:hypothetical protein
MQVRAGERLALRLVARNLQLEAGQLEAASDLACALLLVGLRTQPHLTESTAMNSIIYIIGLVVVVGAVLSWLGMH